MTKKFNDPHACLLRDIFGFSEEELESVSEQLTDEVRETLERVLGRLTPREERLVRMHYGIRTTAMPLAAVGRQLGWPRHRPRAVRDKAFRKLRAPERRDWLVEGLVAAGVRFPGLMELGADAERPFAERPIEALGLDVRTASALRAAGIDTGGKLADKRVRELYSLPGFGRKRVAEVLAELERHGIELRG